MYDVCTCMMYVHVCTYNKILLYRQTLYMSYCAISLIPLLVGYHFISY